VQPELCTPFHFELDLRNLCFMEAHSAWQLISAAAALPEDSRVTIRCGPLLEVVVRGLGSGAVPQPILEVERQHP
jgi:hypothetical protein